MQLETALPGAVTLLLSAGLTYGARRFALARGLIDVPNERSSHATPTPRGGGVAIVIASYVMFAWLLASGSLDDRAFIALLGGLPVAAIGLADDHRRIPARARLAVHVIAALWALAWLGGLPPVPIGHTLWSGRVTGTVLGVLGIVWSVNFFNFMDGIDGIAASEGTFVPAAGALLYMQALAPPGPAAAALALAGACAGFLLWNWSPARIFMGDAGSGYVGYAIAVLALVAARQQPQALFAWWILGGVFFVDATVTLGRRLLRGEPAHQAHRSHAYQRLARRLASHGLATGVVVIINLVWLLPWAWLANARPGAAAGLAVLALSPLAAAAIIAGAGRADSGQAADRGRESA
jgi:Fuc2NAc and GlcNAc transferase